MKLHIDRLIVKGMSILLIFVYTLLYNPRGYSLLANLKVGQGDSALISVGEYKVLIDGGPGDYVTHQIGKYMSADREIDLMILTHPHLDHLSGLLSILDYYVVRKVVMNNVCLENSDYKLLLKKLSDKKVSIIYTDYLKINFLSNELKDISYTSVSKNCLTFSNLNNSSLITLVNIDSKKYLFMGDAELEEEHSFLKKHEDDILNIEYVKLGHHCSRTSTSEEFLKITNPKIVVCSYGLENSYGHPHKETLEKLKKYDIPMYSTAESDVVITLK